MRFLAVLRTGWKGGREARGGREEGRKGGRERHSTPERVLRGNFRLPCANLLKAEQLEENPADQGAVEQPEVNAGELVDS